MSLNNYQGRNRTNANSGVNLDGPAFTFAPITGTGVSPAQAADLAAPIAMLLSQIPYSLDAQGRLAYTSGTSALMHDPELKYAAEHPKAGQLIYADLLGGAYCTKYGGAPMPFIDMDRMHPQTLEMFLATLTSLMEQVASAT